MSDPTEATWSGQWLADRLGLTLTTESPASPLALTDLVGLALRRNPRRAHLLVSSVLGKHVPADPAVVHGAGRLLGAMVADELAGTVCDLAEEGRRLLKAALNGSADAAEALSMRCAEHAARSRMLTQTVEHVVVLGYAETATALGHLVADALDADYLHSTRRPVPGLTESGGFEEEHSHATRHLLLPEDRDMLSRPGPLVLVDDELSTGRTAWNTISALHARVQRSRYVIATLVDLRSAADGERLTSLAAALGVEIVVVALAAGRLDLPGDVLTAGPRLVAEHGTTAEAPSGGSWPHRVPVTGWSGVREGGRHGFDRHDRAALSAAVDRTAAELAVRLTGDRVLVLGFEELMYAPLLVANRLRAMLANVAQVRFSATTRSPVVAIDQPGYAIRTRLSFASHDEPADGPGPRFAYNVAPGSDPSRRFTDIVLVVDDVGDTEALHAAGGLLDQLTGVCGRVHLVTLPSYKPSVDGAALAPPRPLYGPDFGSYARDEVAWLLTDLSAVELEAPTEEREELIQSGRAHYAESLPVEYQPSAEYQRLFLDSLASSATRLAHAVGVVTEMVLAERGHDVVLASLARAGTPVGVLMRRWASFAHQLNVPHYSLSIVRGRGIDQMALRYLATHHRPSSVMFVDGWTGKGAITRELAEAVTKANTQLGPAADGGFSPDLAVLADTGRCVRFYGTREDYLIPSACLNSTVSGLVSRTVLNDALIGSEQFHGAKFYSHLTHSDMSRRFLDAVTAEFPSVLDAVTRQWPSVYAGSRLRSWAGWSAAEELSREYGVNDVNLVKPGVGETTRVLLRRVPWKILMRPDAVADLRHIRMLAEQRGVQVEIVEDLAYRSVGLIRPRTTRAAGEEVRGRTTG
ncbi:phosphoribosyltransferase [Micromonospora chalcea]|uniref:phosphoribosyltransferase n=1 Tax=Micromonospora chalcea TaxID=1874 RepID=UPI0038F6BE31